MKFFKISLIIVSIFTTVSCHADTPLMGAVHWAEAPPPIKPQYPLHSNGTKMWWDGTWATTLSARPQDKMARRWR